MLSSYILYQQNIEKKPQSRHDYMVNIMEDSLCPPTKATSVQPRCRDPHGLVSSGKAGSPM